jgi:alpha-N-arabinofuranosidase
MPGDVSSPAPDPSRSFLRQGAQVAEASVIVLDQPIGTISPRLYGHFAEHLGRCSYGGLWAGAESSPEAIDGFRQDVVEALRELGVPLLRWPGGCYADRYHWRDGIGAPATRPRTLGTSCGLRSADSNALGSHEFMRLCELLGAEPYLALNVGSGTVREACEWVEYMNVAGTSLADERAANGRREPWGVRLWGVGNETWDCGGRFDSVAYAREYARFATMIRQVDPSVELVAVGQEDEPLPESGLDPQWNVHFFEALGPAAHLVDHLSIHRYWIHGGPETAFDEADYYALLDEAASTEGLIKRSARTAAQAAGPGHTIGIALDEWGVWHPEARDWGPGDVARRRPPDFEQARTLRDALAVAIALEGFHRQCRVLSMANLAQIVNVLHAVLVTEGAVCVRTPTYHVFALHRPHIGAEALAVEVETVAAGSARSPAISATASARGDARAVTLVNRDYRRALTATIEVEGRPKLARVLAADSPAAVNTAADPDRVSLRQLDLEDQGSGRWSVVLPPHSVATVEFATHEAEGQ